MKKRIAYGIICAFLCIGVFYMMYQWKELSAFENQAGLRYEGTGLSVSQIEKQGKEQRERKGSKEKDSYLTEATAWKLEKNQSVSQDNTGIQVQADVVKLCGNVTHILPFPVIYGGITVAEDQNGCVISRGLAWKLFGAEAVTGNILQYEGKELKVRAVLDTDKRILVLYQREKQEIMPYIEIWQEGQSPAAQLEQIQSRLGLYEVSYIFAGSFYVSIGRIIISLPFWIIFCYLCRRGMRWCRNSTQKYRKVTEWGGRLLILLGTAAGLKGSISFTGDFIPVQWSDFGFWKEKWQAVFSDIEGRGQFPKIYWEQEVLGLVGKITIAAGITTGLIIVIIYMSSRHSERVRKS